MDLKTLKDLCYSASSAASIATLHEKQMKVAFIKEYFFKNLKNMKVTEGGCSVLDISDRYVRVGVDNLHVVSLIYDPQEPKHSSQSGITALAIDKKSNNTPIEFAIENLNMGEVTSLFVVLSMNLK